MPPGLGLGSGVSADIASTLLWRNAYSVAFDGTNDYVDLGNSSTLNPEDISVSMWIKPDALTNYDYLFARGIAGYNEAYRFQIGATHLYNAFGNGSTKGYITYAHGMSNGNWYHIASTYDGATAAQYVNGASIGTKSISIVMEEDSDTTYIGKPHPAAAYFDGQIDEVGMWDSALSAAQVLSIYNGGTPQSLAGFDPVGWWRMGDNDGGTGTTITDQGSGGNNGTLVNSPTFSTSVP